MVCGQFVQQIYKGSGVRHKQLNIGNWGNHFHESEGIEKYEITCASKFFKFLISESSQFKTNLSLSDLLESKKVLTCW